MHALSRSKSRAAEAGFTLAEILVACAIISVGLVAVATGFGFGVDGVEAGRQQSTAVFLAEQRIEQAKELAMRQTGSRAAHRRATCRPPRPTGRSRALRPATVGPRRSPTNPGGTPGKRVDVVVFYRPVTGRGVLTTERSVSLSIFLANR